MLPGFSNGVWYRDAQMSHTHDNCRIESSTAPAASSVQAVFELVQLYFWGKVVMPPHSAPLHCRAVQTSQSQLQGSLCWAPLCGTDIPWATCCRPQRKPVPVLGIQLPVLELQMNALKARSFLLLRFCALFCTKLEEASENSLTFKEGLLQHPLLGCWGVTHLPISSSPLRLI